MTLRYQTGTAGFIQLAVVMLLIVLNNLISFLQTCVGDTGNCVPAAFVSIVIIVFAALWFGFLSALGYAAQDKRSRRLATALIIGQAITAVSALMILRLPGGWLAALSALIVFVVAIWVAVLAFRLRQSKGGRIVAHPRSRRRLTSHGPDDQA